MDSYNNTIELNYSPIPDVDNYISSITTSSGGAMVFGYDSSYRLTTITDNANRVTRFGYDGDNLKSITRPDGTITSFSYDGTELIAVSENSGKSLNYSYDSQSKISSVTAKGSSGTVGQSLSFDYKHNQTVVTDNQGRNTTYQFDTFGRVTCVYDDQFNICSKTYTNNITSDVTFKNNKAQTVSNQATYIDNLFTNGAFTNGISGWNKSNDTITISTEAGLLTSNSVKIANSTSGTTVIMQYPTVSTGVDYTVSAYIKAQDVVSSTHGAGIEVITSSRFIYSDFITGTTDTNTDNGFKKVTYTFRLESGETLSRITVGLYNSTGTLYIDSVQLEQSDTANSINLLSNSGFEKNTGTSALPTGFSSNFTAGISGSSSSADKKSGSYSLRIAGNATQKGYVYQTLNISGKSGDIYSFGGWARAQAVGNHSENVDDFKLTAGVYYTNGKYLEYPVDLNEYVTEWQYASGNFIAEYDYSQIKIYCSYNFNANTAYFDNMFLYRDTAQSYRYDNNGNVVSTADYAAQQSSLSYNSDDTLSKVLDPDGSGYEYNYYKHYCKLPKARRALNQR